MEKKMDDGKSWSNATGTERQHTHISRCSSTSSEAPINLRIWEGRKGRRRKAIIFGKLLLLFCFEYLRGIERCVRHILIDQAITRPDEEDAFRPTTCSPSHGREDNNNTWRFGIVADQTNLKRFEGRNIENCRTEKDMSAKACEEGRRDAKELKGEKGGETRERKKECRKVWAWIVARRWWRERKRTTNHCSREWTRLHIDSWCFRWHVLQFVRGQCSCSHRGMRGYLGSRIALARKDSLAHGLTEIDVKEWYDMMLWRKRCTADIGHESTKATTNETKRLCFNKPSYSRWTTNILSKEHLYHHIPR